jgi:hypothetical protein
MPAAPAAAGPAHSEVRVTKYQIICKRKHAQYERVEAIGCIDPATGAERRFTEDEAIRRIEAGTARFVVHDDRGNEAVVEIEEREGRKYLITRRDGIKTDNILAMPECPAKIAVAPPPPITYRPVRPAPSHAVHPQPEKP